MMLSPQQNYLCVKKQKSTIHISGEQNSQKAEVIAQGPGHLSPEGILVPIAENYVGKTVLYEKFANSGTTALDDEGNEYLFIKSTEIVAVED